MRPLLILAVLAVPSLSEACYKCGYRSPCAYIQRVAVKVPVPVPVAAPAPQVQNTWVVQNSYPGPFVGAGATQPVSNGGYAQLTSPIFDLNNYLAGRLEVQKAAIQMTNIESTRADALAQHALTVQAPALERSTAGLAASMVLQSAGLTPAAQAGVMATLITRDAQGRSSVVPLDPAQMAQMQAYMQGAPQGNQPHPNQPYPNQPYPNQPNQPYPQPSPPQLPPGVQPGPPENPPGQAGNLLGRFCGECHGADKADPKGSPPIQLGNSPQLAQIMRDRLFEIRRQVKSGEMPPKEKPQLTLQERDALLEEVEVIIDTHLR
jgi:hypothetical protein